MTTLGPATAHPLSSLGPKNYRSQLNEWAQHQDVRLVYTKPLVVRESGQVAVILRMGRRQWIGYGKTEKQAKEDAASLAFRDVAGPKMVNIYTRE